MPIFQRQYRISELPNPRKIGDKGLFYSIETPRGNFNLRDFSSSAAQIGVKWTIDVPKEFIGAMHDIEI